MAQVFRAAARGHALVRFRFRRMFSSEPARVLIIQLAHMGDGLMLTPVLKALRREHPHLKVSLLLNSYTAPFFKSQTQLELEHVWELDTIKFRKPGFDASAQTQDQPWEDQWFDAVVLVRYSPRLLPYVLIGKYGRAVFYDYGTYPLRKGWMGLLTGTPVHSSARGVQNNVALVAAALATAGYPLRDLGHISVFSSDAELRRVSDWLAEADIQSAGYLVLAPGAPFPYRQWPAERYAELFGRVLATNPALKIFLIGAAHESALHQAIMTQLDPRIAGCVRSVAGEFSWGELAAFISQARVLVGTDGGLVHLASATSTPVIALYGPQMPEIFGPWQPAPGSRVLHKRRFCSPCWQRGCVSPQHYCMMDISVDEVEDALRAILSKLDAVAKTVEEY